MHLDPQINIDRLRIEKLISLFEPLYSTSGTTQMKSMYGEYIKNLKNELHNIDNNIKIDKLSKIKEDIQNGKNKQFNRK